MRIVVVGLGRMGRAVITEAETRGHTVAAAIGSAENARQEALTPERLEGTQVAIEFTRANAAPANLDKLIDLGIPVVTGTTGWLDRLPGLADHVRKRDGALLHAANFSPGLHLLLAAAREVAARLASDPSFDAAIAETHHNKKLDAPSGTALLLQRELRAVDSSRPYSITSQRLGAVPGTHSLLLDAAHESLELTHTVRDRSVYAAGAVLAAEWLLGRRGVFTFDDLFHEVGASR